MLDAENEEEVERQDARLKAEIGGAPRTQATEKLPNIVSLSIKTDDNGQKKKAYGQSSKAP